MKIIWTSEALNNIIEIENYISQDNPSKAIEFTDFLISKCKYLINHPEMGRVVTELNNPGIREFIVKDYRIVYRVFEDEIQVLTVFEGYCFLPLNH